MTHIEKVTELRTAWTQAILNHFRDNNMGMIKFNNMFSCLLPVENMFGDFEKVGCFIARRMTIDGILIGMDEGLSEEAEWSVNDLDVMEIAYILVILEAGAYRKLDDSYDPEQDDEEDVDNNPF